MKAEKNCTKDERGKKREVKSITRMFEISSGFRHVLQKH